MSIILNHLEATFSDIVAISDADIVLEWVQQNQGVSVDLSACSHLHPAVIQILLASGACVSAWPTDPDLARWLSILRANPGSDQ